LDLLLSVEQLSANANIVDNSKSIHLDHVEISVPTPVIDLNAQYRSGLSNDKNIIDNEQNSQFGITSTIASPKTLINNDDNSINIASAPYSSSDEDESDGDENITTITNSDKRSIRDEEDVSDQHRATKKFRISSDEGEDWHLKKLFDSILTTIDAKKKECDTLAKKQSKMDKFCEQMIDQVNQSRERSLELGKNIEQLKKDVHEREKKLEILSGML